MDLDPVGADLSGESQLTVDPSSGLDPTRQVKYIPTAATAIYPNVVAPLLTGEVSGGDESVTPNAPKALQIVPVVGQNVPSAPVDLSPPNAMSLKQINPNLYMQAGQGQTQIAQVPEPKPTPLAPAPVRPGTGQGLFGSNITPVQPYDPNADDLEVAKRNARAKAERLEGYARDPLMQFLFKSQTDKAMDDAIERRMKADQIDQEQQRQRAIQLEAENAGLTGKFGNEKLVVESMVKDYLSGDPIKAGRAANMLTARGHADIIKGLEDQSAAAMEDQFSRRQKITDKLDTATTDQEYQQLRDKLQKQDPGYKIPKTFGEWNTPAQRGARKAAENKALNMIEQHRTRLAEQGDYTEELDAAKAASYAKSASYYQGGETMHNTQGSTHKGNMTHGGMTPAKSARVTTYGEDWDTYDKAAQDEIEKIGEAAYPKTERGKNLTVMRTIRMATTDPETGKPMDDEATRKHINTNPNVGQAVAEALATALRGGAGGANGQLIKLELAKRGKVQGTFDEAMSAWAGAKGIITGKEYKYLTDLTQSQIRYVLDFIKRDTEKDITNRLGPMAERAGMYGAKPENLPVEDEFKAGLSNRLYIGREKQVEHMGNQARVISGDRSVFLGPNNAATQAVPGAFTSPVPARMLPHLYPELSNPVPAETPEPTKPPGKRSEAEEPGILSKVASALNPISSAQAAETPPPPTAPAPQAPGQPATTGLRGGGTFSNGVPSNGFPQYINKDPVGRTVYSVAGQTVQNVMGSPTAGTNAAVVAASSAQSESSNDPNATHDGGRGYGLFGHNGDRLAGMHQFAGTKPGEAIPPNVQAAWFAREMARAAQHDGFIARVLNDPNATAEDLTRVQIRMEQPKGYKGPGTEEKADNWGGRLAHTRELMAGQPAAAVTATPVPAVVAQPAGGVLNPANVREALASRSSLTAGAMDTAISMAPAVAGTVVGGAVGGPVGAVAGGAITQGAVNAVRNYLTGTPEQQTLGGYAKTVGIGAAQGGVMGIPGARPAMMATRVGLSSIIPGFEKWLEGGDTGQIMDAAMGGAVGGTVGEGFGAALGAAGNVLWKTLAPAGKAELMSVGKTLATEKPKVMDATGKMVENPTYTAALDRAKQLHQEPDNLAHAWNSTEGQVAKGAEPVTKGEALITRPGATEVMRQGRELQNIENQVGAQQVRPTAVPYQPKVMHDPNSVLGQKGMTTGPEFRKAGNEANAWLNARAANVQEEWSNAAKARTGLLNRLGETAEMPKFAGQKVAIDTYRAMADKVRDQQRVIAERMYPNNPGKVNRLMDHLDKVSNDYRRAVLASDGDIIKTIAAGGQKGREVDNIIKGLMGKDPEAKQMMAALTELHKRAAAKQSLGTALYVAHHFPVVGPLVAKAIAGHGFAGSYKLLKAYWASKGAGNKATFMDLVNKVPPRVYIPRGVATPIGAQIGANALVGSQQQ